MWRSQARPGDRSRDRSRTTERPPVEDKEHTSRETTNAHSATMKTSKPTVQGRTKINKKSTNSDKMWQMQWVLPHQGRLLYKLNKQTVRNLPSIRTCGNKLYKYTARQTSRQRGTKTKILLPMQFAGSSC